VIVQPLVPGSVLLLAPVRGVAAEVPSVLGELDRFEAGTVGLATSVEELQGLNDYFVVGDGEPIVPLTPNEFHEVRGLVRFGEVRVPNPSFLCAIRWARDRGRAVLAVDPDEEHAATLFAEHIGYIELVRRTVREHRMGRSPPTPSSPDAYAVDWDRRVAGGRGSRRLAAARDSYLAAAVRRIAAGGTRVAVLVDRERFDGVKAAWAAGPASAA
jgi:hypothetical protein